MSENQAPETEVTEATTDGKTRIEIPTDKYVDSKSASGSKTKHNGDAVATALAGQPLENVYGIASEMLDTPVEDLQAKYAHLNVGQQRMNLGNRIRGAVNKRTKHAESEAGQKEDALTGETILAQIADGYPLPEPEVKEQSPESAEAEDA